MQLIAHGEVREQDLANIESPFFACSKVRLLLSGSAHWPQIRDISRLTRPAPASDCQQGNEKLLREIEEGSWFLLIPSGPGPFRPAVRWQSGREESADDRWTVDESLSPTARFKLEQVIARIEHGKYRALPQQEIIPISGTPRSGIFKRYANFFSAHHAFPEHLTAAEEKGLGSSIRNLYGGNDTIQNQADITAFNETPSVLGVTHGQIFDAMENVVAVAGLIEGGLGLSKLKDLGKIAEGGSSGLYDQARISATTANEISSATSSISRIKLSNQLLAEEISSGHAFERHVEGEASSINEFSEFGVHTREDFAKFIEEILSAPSDARAYSNGRSAILHEETGTIIIKNSSVGESTAFRPKYDVGWERYLKGLPKLKIQLETVR